MIRLLLPEGYNEYAWEVEAKGYLWDACVELDGRVVAVTFYDATRLAQDVAEESIAGRVFAAKRLLVVPSVTQVHMEAAVKSVDPTFFVT